MKNLFKFGILSLFLIVLATSCEEDLTTTPTPGPGTTTDNPEIALLDEAGFISATTTVAPGATFTIKLQAAKGANDLSGILFDLDGSPFGRSTKIRLKYGGRSQCVVSRPTILHIQCGFVAT